MLNVPGTGVAHYSHALVHSLISAGLEPTLLYAEAAAERNAAFRDGDFTLWDRIKRWSAAVRTTARHAESHDPCEYSGSNQTLVAPDLFRQAQVHFSMYGRLMKVRCDRAPGIMHWTYPVPLYMEGWHNIYTIHDVIPLNQADLTSIKISRHRRLLECVAQQAERLITVSETAKKEILAELGCPADFVVNSSQAVHFPDDQGMQPPEAASSKSYFLFCGSIEPRKNLERLVEAYRRSGTDRTLVIVGPDGWQGPRIRGAIESVPGVMLLPFQTREQLASLMRHARGLLFPSLGEGFGLPVAEAMTLGTPVMTSAGGALAEIGGAATMLINPYDINAMARAIARLSEDDLLCERMSVAGMKRSAMFTPASYAIRLQAMYANVASAR